MTRLLNIFATIAGVLSIQADPFADDLVANFTALLGNPDVHKFIDKALMDAPPPPNPNSRELDEVLGDGDLASGRDRYRFCSKCKTIHSTAINAYFYQQITEICEGDGNADSLPTYEFCAHLKKRIASLDQILNGYIFVRSRALQLATSTCIGTNQCPTKDAYNAFFNPIVPGRLIDFTKLDYCPCETFPKIETCFEQLSTRMLKYAIGEVKYACDNYEDKGLDEFCGYVATDSHFGAGLVFGFVGVYEQATGYCVRDQCR
ncbi:hypothetical protein Pmar_PMAR028480 [Perkinsus marinus ATCC 50983]|uniref:Saposin B-type domain-containing protein n=1 Tax=Perkinsus marinus (strain ATCC 50983 / TXsc) TaxID=423536 RepID=C5LM89_PERM5|nr:hypothetical protein Pmar_PMAR028480 [Perkinsus marinus ATCC 50983]EER02101.1 hypothetical protein Pmar_PMAR028480 [Perkinsus marinus ATCC 50983]|eukprot:XP_002769383.1 hypothetical protein Pmar_PMAR028480 [Perkinsus marinus ATCC 50983]